MCGATALLLKAPAAQLPPPFNERVGAASFDDGLNLEARHIVLADDRYIGKFVLQEFSRRSYSWISSTPGAREKYQSISPVIKRGPSSVVYFGTA